MSAETLLVRQMSYQGIVNDLRKAIDNGKLCPGMSILPEREMAEKYGLSLGTVRKGIQELVDAGMLEKIHGKGTFVTTARPATEKALLHIGIIVPTLKISYFAEIVEEAESIANAKGFSLTLIISGASEDIPGKVTAIPEIAALDGIICTQSLAADAYRQLSLAAKKAQFFFIDSRVTGEEVASATCDDFYGGMIATEHLIEQGCRNIVHLHGDGAGINVGLRRDGYCAAMRQHGLEPRLVDSRIHFVNAAAAINRMIEEKQPLPDGIFCPTDMAAMGAISALLRHGIKVPEQVAVAGYSNLLEAEQYYPSITSVELDIPGLTKYAFNEIVNQIQHPDGIKSQVRFSPKLHIRESSQWKKHH